MTLRYDIHEAADIFPVMDPARFAELVDDIRTNGLMHDIVRQGGKIVDGRHRFLACGKAGVEPRFVDYEGNPYDYAWSCNAQRRDLSAGQRAAIWLEVEDKSGEWQRKQAEVAEHANTARSEAAHGNRNAAKDKNSPATKCGDTVRDYQGEQSKKTASAAAKASGTNRGAIERQQQLREKRPDLAAKGSLRRAKAERGKMADAARCRCREIKSVAAIR